MTLTRHKPLRAKPRSKGARGERAVIDILKAHGWTGAYRNQGSGAFGGGDIIGGPAGVNLEVKHHERCDIWAWLRQCEGDARPTDIPVVVCRANGMAWWAVLPEDEFGALEELDPPQGCVVVVVDRGPGRRLSLWRDLSGLRGFDRVRFWREGGTVYVAVPFERVLGLLRLREFG